MATTKKLIADLLSHLSDAVARSDNEGIQRAIYALQATGSQKNQASTQTKTAKSKVKQPVTKDLFERDPQLISRLYEFESREALHRFIEQNLPRKIDLISAFRATKVPINKLDDYETLVEKLIDGTIGYKLRSRAIRGDG